MQRSSVSRMKLLATLAVCSIAALGASRPSAAIADQAYTLNIPAQDLGGALKAFGAAVNEQVLFSRDVVAGLRSTEVKGEFTSKAAILILLKDSGLQADRTPAGVLLIRRPPNAHTLAANGDDVPDAAGANSDSKEGKNSSSDGFRVAQVDQGQAAGDTSVKNGEREESAQAKAVKLEEIVVTGTHIRGEESIGSETITLSREDIDSSGFGRIEDILAQLPQNFSGNNELNPSLTQSVASANAALGAEVQLRGLGVGTTLTLVNGIRQPAGGVQGAFVDVSMIPTSAIERVEVLADGASAIYGSDAIGGVVNLILRKDYDGAETRVRYGSTNGGADETQFSQLFGTKWATGSVLVGYQFFRRGELMASDRPLSALGENFTSVGGSDFRSFPYASNPGTILTPGTTYAIPKGQNGAGLTAADLIPGTANNADYVGNVWILPRQQMNSAFFNASQTLGDTFELFADGMFSTREFAQLEGGYKTIVSVPSTNPFYVNPSGGTGRVRVAYDFSRDLGPVDRTGTVDGYTGTLGAKARLPREWQLTLTGSYGSERSSAFTNNLVLGSLVRPAVADSDPATALNVFGDGSYTNPATLASIRYDQHQVGVSDVFSTSLVADGPLFRAPGGTARLAVGGDYRDETLHAMTPSETPPLDARDSRGVLAGFAEMAVPIVAPRESDGAHARLELSIAGRYEHYSDFGQTFNPKIGLNWLALPGVKVRGTWGTSFHAPAFEYTDLAFYPVGSYSQVVTDPKSPTGVSNTVVLYGNNPNLKPEKAHVWTAGLDLTPTPTPGLKLSITYFDIAYKDKVGSLLDPTTALQLESIWAPIITRNPTPAQLAPICNSPNFFGDCTGAAAIIDDRLLNLAVVDVSGVDANLSGSFPTGVGTFKATIGGTYTDRYDVAVTSNAPTLSVLNTVGFPLRLRLRTTASWSLRGWSVGAVVNHTGAYENPGVTPDTVASFTTVDLHIGYASTATTGWLGRTELFLSAVNVANRQPPFVNQPGGYDGANASLLGRLVSVQLVKGW